MPLMNVSPECVQVGAFAWNSIVDTVGCGAEGFGVAVGGLAVAFTVGRRVAVFVGASVGARVAVFVGTGVFVDVGMGVMVGRGVRVGVTVAKAINTSLTSQASAPTMSAAAMESRTPHLFGFIAVSPP